ncbi:9623_t:CDS:2, partial [Funneliformis mosseae]
KTDLIATFPKAVRAFKSFKINDLDIKNAHFVNATKQQSCLHRSNESKAISPPPQHRLFLENFLNSNSISRLISACFKNVEMNVSHKAFDMFANGRPKCVIHPHKHDFGKLV